MVENSPFFDRPRVAENEHAFAIRDAFPVTDGHTLVVPKRPVADYFELSGSEQKAVWDLINTVKQSLDADLRPEGYNIGINVGESAGQTIAHAHVHLIPRRRGDHPNPRGGVRAVIPGKAEY